MSAIADSAIRSFSDEPKFVEIMSSEEPQAMVLVDAIIKGEISKEDAAKTIAAGKAELTVAAGTDSLTELPNRAELFERLREHVALAKRAGMPITVAFLDLDNFKEFNDRLSHDAGDVVLCAAADYLKSKLRESDQVGRWGGEEFVLSLPFTDEAGAYNVLEDLRLDLNGSVTQVAFDVGQYELGRSVTASIGFVTVTIDKTDPRSAQDITYDLIDIADKRMHFAKEHGKNRVVGSKQETQQTQQP